MSRSSLPGRRSPGQPTIVALPVPRPYGDYGKIVDWRIDESFPEAVGAFIDWLVKESGWTVEEEGRAVPIRPRHIAILFRRFRNFGDGRHAALRPCAGSPAHPSRACGWALVP